MNKERLLTFTRIGLAVVAIGGAALSVVLRSLPGLARLLPSPSPISFALVTLLVGVGFVLAVALQSTRRTPLRARTTASLVIATVAIAVLTLLIFKLHTPAEWQRYYLDVTLVPLVVFAASTLVLRPVHIWRVALASLYLFLAWPPLLIKLVAWLTPPLIVVTKWLTIVFARITVLPVVDAARDNVLTLTSKDFSVTIGEVCAGTATVLAVVVLAIPVITLVRGSLSRKLGLGVLAVVLGVLANSLRTFSIFVVAYLSTPELALGFYHSVAGAITFTLLAVVLLVVGWRLRLGRPSFATLTLPRFHYLTWAAAGVLIGGVGLAGLALVPFGRDAAPAQPGLAEEGVVPKSGGDPAALNQNVPEHYKLTFREPLSYVPPREGFDLKNFSLSFADNLFGPTADYERFEYIPADGSPSYFADVAVTPSGNDLLALNTEICYEFHGYQIYFQEELVLNRGLRAFFFTYRDNDGKIWESVDFTTPTSDDLGHTFFRRIKLVRIVRGASPKEFSEGRQELLNFAYGIIDTLFTE